MSNSLHEYPGRTHIADKLDNGAGVIIYRWDRENDTLHGTFALRMYNGALATELVRRVDGSKNSVAGVYDIDTLTPSGTIFARGSLIVKPIGDAGVYDVTYILAPEKEGLQLLGFAEGTRMYYKGIGMGPPVFDGLIAAWDNNEYIRAWSVNGHDFEEWGMRFVANAS